MRQNQSAWVHQWLCW